MAKAADLRVGGVQPFTSLDFPGRLAAVIFTQGCPLRCGYCHNPDLIAARRRTGLIPWADVEAHLHARRGLIDGVAFSGGEPLAQAALIPAIRQVRGMGFAIALHSAGTAPARLAAVLDDLDWVGLDIKAPFDAYEDVTGVAGSGDKARASLALLAASGVDYELRTTVWPDRIGAAELRAIARQIAPYAPPRWAVQEMRTPGANGRAVASPVFASAALWDELRAITPHCEPRRAH